MFGARVVLVASLAAMGLWRPGIELEEHAMSGTAPPYSRQSSLLFRNRERPLHERLEFRRECLHGWRER